MNYSLKLLYFFIYYSGLSRFFDFLYYKILRKVHVPVLVYHSISAYNNDNPLSVSKHTFNKQLKYLNSRYNFISFSEVTTAIKNFKTFKKHPISITLDDGIKDNYTNALPIIKKFNAKATIFLTSRNIDAKTDDEFKRFFPFETLTTANIIEMNNNGIEFGSHTMTHPVLSFIDIKAQENEIKGAIKIIEGIINSPIKTFAYPFGGKDSFTMDTIQILKDIGILSAAVVYNGLNNFKTNRFEIKRVIILDEPLYIFKVRISVFNVFINYIISILRLLYDRNKGN